jgi:dsDNA-specific endonuclease/ATPase MutS2
MQAAVLHALEFDRIRDVLASRALTALGQTRLLALEPSAEVGVVLARLALMV